MKIAILGYGVEGKSAYKFYKKRGAEIDVFDEKDIRGADFVKQIQDFSEVDFNKYDLILKSPSMSPKALIKIARAQGAVIKITSMTNEFFKHCPAEIIGVTGTEGKGTTCSLITEILKAAGKKVWLVGNIGMPAFDVLEEISVDDVVVYELSSFQLWDMKKSPTVAVVVHIEEDHLDKHEDMNEYLAAKANMVRWQKPEDTIIYDDTNEYCRSIATMSDGKKQIYPTGKFELLLDALKIPGEHNRRNGEAAILAARTVTDVSDSQVSEGLAAFEGLPHRLKFVREVRGVKFYDDSISTTPGSAIAAIRAFEAPKILILGGSSKGTHFGKLAQEIACGGVKKVLAIGVSADEIVRELKSARYENVENLGIEITMSEIVERAMAATKVGDVIILSPACASFDMFLNYGDRGDQFRVAAEAIN